jgi:hypothetical protein
MKIKHGILEAKTRGVLAGFAVLFLVAIVTLTGCGDGAGNGDSGGGSVALTVTGVPSSITKDNIYGLTVVGAEEPISGGTADCTVNLYDVAITNGTLTVKQFLVSGSQWTKDGEYVVQINLQDPFKTLKSKSKLTFAKGKVAGAVAYSDFQ